MRIRGWLIVGGAPSTLALPQENSIGHQWGALPDAADFSPGNWITWARWSDTHAVTLVCVELPMSFG